MSEEIGRADRFCGSAGNGADIGVFGMMSSILLTAQLIINIINSSNNNNNNNNDRNNNNNNNNLNDNSMVTVMPIMNVNMNMAMGRQFKKKEIKKTKSDCISFSSYQKLTICRQRLGIFVMSFNNNAVCKLF